MTTYEKINNKIDKHKSELHTRIFVVIKTENFIRSLNLMLL